MIMALVVKPVNLSPLSVFSCNTGPLKKKHFNQCRVVLTALLWAQTPLNLTGFFYDQVEESLNDMDFQLLLELHFTDGDYT